MYSFTIINPLFLDPWLKKQIPCLLVLTDCLKLFRMTRSLLQQNMRMAITAEAVCEVARAADIEITPGDLVKHYATLLTNASDAVAVENFDLCSWDVGELLWAMRQWKS